MINVIVFFAAWTCNITQFPCSYQAADCLRKLLGQRVPHFDIAFLD
jgi:hypothetical protein